MEYCSLPSRPKEVDMAEDLTFAITVIGLSIVSTVLTSIVVFNF